MDLLTSVPQAKCCAARSGINHRLHSHILLCSTVHTRLPKWVLYNVESINLQCSSIIIEILDINDPTGHEDLLVHV